MAKEKQDKAAKKAEKIAKLKGKIADLFISREKLVAMQNQNNQQLQISLNELQELEKL